MAWCSDVFVFSAVLAIVCGLRYWRSRRQMWALASQIPGPRTYPIVGNALLFRNLSQTLNILLNLHKEFGPLIRTWFGSNLYVWIAHPDDVQHVLGNRTLINRDVRMTSSIEAIIGNGLLSYRGEDWISHRKLVSPIFQFHIVKNYLKIFGNRAEILARNLDKIVDEQCIDIHKHLAVCTLDSFCETALGTTTTFLADGVSDLASTFHFASGLIYNRVTKPWQQIDWIYRWTSDGRKAKRVSGIIKNLNKKVIANKLEEYRSGIRRPSITTASGKTIKSFLDLMIEASESQGSLMSVQDMHDEALHLASAGFETTATTLASLFLLVGVHQDVQEQVYEELKEIFGDDPRTATNEDIARMHVLDRVIKETMRMFPVIVIQAREIEENVPLPSGHTLPKGSTAIVFPYATHRLEEFYPEPDKFWPDRWLPENSPPRHPYAYLAFGAGVRNCVGAKYAMLQMKTILSTLLRRYKVTTNYKMEDLLKLEVNIILTLGVDKYGVRLEKRH